MRRLSENEEALSEHIREEIIGDVDVSRDLTDDEIRSHIREWLLEEGHEYEIPLQERILMEERIFNSLRKLDILEELLSDDEITEIMVNGPENIFIEKKGHLFKSPLKFSSKEKLSDVIQQIAAERNKIINESSPILDTRLPDGSRINIILPPIALNQGVLTIRRFPKEKITMKKLIELGSVSTEIVDFLRILITAGYNIFISGGTGSGKTTFLNALTEFIPKGERVITIEDSAELQVIGIENLVRLEARDKNLEGNLEVTIRDLVKASLRMRPDRIIVGECRGAEALEVLQAFNTGHDGSLSTGHANSAKDMLSRLETMVLMGMELPVSAIRAQIASGVDILVHLGRLSDGSRKLLEVSEVRGIEDGEIVISPIFQYSEDGTKKWERKGKLENTRKLSMAGLLDEARSCCS
ncbi:MAG: CpaF family protein [Lachnospiraceae bacterium]|uniref:CpaF family protein n=1 Tax=Candidatus Weimeria bifida TaxID=2599074 RepID=A0A6N7J393_9FIRM|nr:CpaF family protein [Candidatus Weimeria bifida]RRF96848.1 MAG: CpaF family protein [Lachnospiraceae bacterium]